MIFLSEKQKIQEKLFSYLLHEAFKSNLPNSDHEKMKNPAKQYFLIFNLSLTAFTSFSEISFIDQLTSNLIILFEADKTGRL